MAASWIEAAREAGREEAERRKKVAEDRRVLGRAVVPSEKVTARFISRGTRPIEEVVEDLKEAEGIRVFNPPPEFVILGKLPTGEHVDDVSLKYSLAQVRVIRSSYYPEDWYKLAYGSRWEISTTDTPLGSSPEADAQYLGSLSAIAVPHGRLRLGGIEYLARSGELNQQIDFGEIVPAGALTRVRSLGIKDGLQEAVGRWIAKSQIPTGLR
jgi:hypothetical protein